VTLEGYPPGCDNVGRSDGAAVIDDVSGGTKSIRVPTCNIHANSDTFDFTFANDETGQENSKIDLHQVGGGYGAHYWFTHSAIDSPAQRRLEIKGTWTFAPIVDGLARVLVHRPSHTGPGGTVGGGAATYTVDTANGPVQVKLNQFGTYNEWVSLGEFSFFGNPKVHLSNLQAGPEVPTDVVFDAVAIQPLTGEGGVDYNPQIRHVTDQCLMLEKNSSANGAFLGVRACSVWTADYWTVKQVAEDGKVPVFQIKDRGTGRCLEIADASQDEGARAREGTCDAANTNQQWTGVLAENSSEVIFEYVRRNMNSKQCVLPDTTPEGAVVVAQKVCPTQGSMATWLFEMS
jgi:hypothetical protein